MQETTIETVRNGIRALETFYRLWEEGVYGPEVDRPIDPTRYVSHDEIMEKVNVAHQAGRLLLSSPDAKHIALCWTHGECCAVALMLHYWLKEMSVESEIWVVESPYHAFLKVGDFWCDGLMWTNDVQEIYRANLSEPGPVVMSGWEQNLFYSDPFGMIRTSQWMELIGASDDIMGRFEQAPDPLTNYCNVDYLTTLFGVRAQVKKYISSKCVALEVALGAQPVTAAINKEQVLVGKTYYSRRGIEVIVDAIGAWGTDRSQPMVVYRNVRNTFDSPAGSVWVLPLSTFAQRFSLEPKTEDLRC